MTSKTVLNSFLLKIVATFANASTMLLSCISPPGPGIYLKPFNKCLAILSISMFINLISLRAIANIKKNIYIHWKKKVQSRRNSLDDKAMA